MKAFVDLFSFGDKVLFFSLIYLFIGATMNLMINIDIKAMSHGIFKGLDTKVNILNFLSMGTLSIFYFMKREGLEQSSKNLVYLLERYKNDDDIDIDYAQTYLKYLKNPNKFQISTDFKLYLFKIKENILKSSNIDSSIKEEIEQIINNQ